MRKLVNILKWVETFEKIAPPTIRSLRVYVYLYVYNKKYCETETEYSALVLGMLPCP